MTNYSDLYNFLREEDAHKWAEELALCLPAAFDPNKHGDWERWQKAIDDLPSLQTTYRQLNTNAITLGSDTDISQADKHSLKQQLEILSPWRKGGFDLFGVYIDAEWRSDLKWDRLKNHIAPLTDKLVLDVGSGNGYHCWRMLGAGAKRVIGIDPMLISVMQFQLIKKLYGENAPIDVLPLGIEKIPRNLKLFDTVFSMGVLYHRQSPLGHLYELRDCLKAGGELVLETIVIDGGLGETLVPEGRYAQMRNVWFLPSCPTLMSWLKRCGFTNIRLIDVSVTTSKEQRLTEWMQFSTLKDFLDPQNSSLTCEGLPAPKRAIILATAAS